MSHIVIYHNGQCSKCKGALELLIEKGVPHEVRWYASDPLTRKELQDLLSKLHMQAHELVRTGEELYKAEYETRNISEDEWMDILINKPELMQRPIVVKGDIAIIARPPEKVLEIL
ncbi:MAG: arsenate reductase (glutaredoxin) [Bacteroidetes bacterium]|nr:arsenate reductase (glutaredoxin) [Bacteroidota bacterium]